jgi:hypothetical protein
VSSVASLGNSSGFNAAGNLDLALCSEEQGSGTLNEFAGPFNALEVRSGVSLMPYELTGAVTGLAAASSGTNYLFGLCGQLSSTTLANWQASDSATTVTTITP